MQNKTTFEILSPGNDIASLVTKTIQKDTEEANCYRPKSMGSVTGSGRPEMQLARAKVTVLGKTTDGERNASTDSPLEFGRVQK
jgi:hypothetical protein